MTTIAFVAVGLTIFLLLLFAPFSKSTLRRATITPLASIIGSGSLVSAPLLASEFGSFAAPAMALLIVVAGLVGWVIRYDIRVVEPELAKGMALASFEEISHIVLAFAYFISVTYYQALPGAFVLKAMSVDSDLLARSICIGLVLMPGAVGWTGGVQKVASLD